MTIVCHRLGQNRRRGLPDASLTPAPEALVHRHPLAIFLRQVAPRRAGAHPPENAVHNGPVVARRAALAPTLGRQEVLQQPPLRFAQIASAHESLPSGGILESRFDSRVNHFVNST
jgi:hypothetical protein